jgi:NAD(P)-dependent dehydrogenase (short-subunit alcohol dehydrogenase family)
MKTNSNRIALITGGNRGLGLQTARDLGKHKDIHIILGVRELKSADDALKSLKAEGVEAEAVQLDVAKPETYDAVYKLIEKNYGRLDILVNNAGVWKESKSPSGGRPANASTVSSAILRETFDTNFFGTVALTQRLLPLIRKSAAGRIVNVSSILGSLTLHADPKSPIYESKVFGYDTSKAALNSFTIHLAYELRDTNIKVNSAHPGWVKTDMGGENATLEVSEGGKTSARLATLPADGPTGGYFHLDQRLPW